MRLADLNISPSELKSKLEDLGRRLEQPVPQDEMAEIGQAYKSTQEILDLYLSAAQLEQDLKSTQELLDQPDFTEIAESEIAKIEQQLSAIYPILDNLTSPRLSLDENKAILEFRAGTGGTEAALFTDEMRRAYIKYLESQKMPYEILAESAGEEGGLKESVLAVNAAGSYGILRFESGVHRVQRVPRTEAAGRIHTSAISIVVMPQITNNEIQIKENELRIDVYRSSGPGGQSVNTTDSAVRITHVPSGIVVTCQDSKSQHKNKDRAMEILRSKLFAIEQERQQSSSNELRSLAIQSGDRSAKIRTYNFPQGRVTDHRVKVTWYKLAAAMEGELHEIITTSGTMIRKGESGTESDSD